MAEQIADTPPLIIPDMCCCCLAEAEASYAISGHTHKEFGFVMTTQWRLPICSACQQRLAQTQSRKGLAVLMFSAAALLTWLSYTRFGGWSFLILLAGALVATVMLWRHTRSVPAIVGWSLLDELQDCVHVDTRFGLVPICQLPRFENQDYEREFREVNGIERLRAARVEKGRSEAEAHHAFSIK